MNAADYLVIAVVVLSALVGLFRGFLREVTAVITWVLAVIFAWRLAGLLDPHLSQAIADPTVRAWVARGLIFVGVLFVGSVVGVLLGNFVRLSIFGGVDRFLGLLFGLVRGVVVVGVLAVLCQTVHLDREAWWRKAMLRPYVESAASVLRAVAGAAREREYTVSR
jgi:membrane protein required for colicin V production